MLGSWVVAVRAAVPAVLLQVVVEATGLMVAVPVRAAAWSE